MAVTEELVAANLNQNDKSIEKEVTFPPVSVVISAPNEESNAPKTGPGQLMLARQSLQDLSREKTKNAALEVKLNEFEGALITRRLAPNLIVRSILANRDKSEFETHEFKNLKEEIKASQGNVQPIRVRPLITPTDRGELYEIVFGHRRHQACLELGIPVLSMIEDADNKSLWLAMDRENRERKSLTPYEQGQSIKRALDYGLFKSVRELAIESGIDQSNANKALQLAKLPEVVIKAFSSSTDLQIGWASKLAAAQNNDMDGLLIRAKSIIERRKRGNLTELSPKEIFGFLINSAPLGDNASSLIDLKKNGEVIATIRNKNDGSIQIDIRHGNLCVEDVQAAIARLLNI